MSDLNNFINKEIYSIRDALFFGEPLLQDDQYFHVELSKRYSLERHEFLDKITSFQALVTEVPAKADKPYIVAAIGNGNCGKSTFLNQFIGRRDFFNTSMSQETSCQWRVQLDPTREYTMRQRWLRKVDDVESEEGSDQFEDINDDNQSLELLIQKVKSLKKSSSSDGAGSMQDQYSADNKVLSEIHLSIPILSQFDNKVLTSRIELLDLPGIEEAALSVQIMAYLEKDEIRNSLIPVILIPLTCGGFHKLTQYHRLRAILTRVKQPQTIIFTQFEKFCTQVEGEMLKRHPEPTEEQEDELYYEKIRKSIEHYAECIRKDLGENTHFFISDFVGQWQYRFEVVEDVESKLEKKEKKISLKLSQEEGTLKAGMAMVNQFKTIGQHFNKILGRDIFNIRKKQAHTQLIKHIENLVGVIYDLKTAGDEPIKQAKEKVKKQIQAIQGKARIQASGIIERFIIEMKTGVQEVLKLMSADTISFDLNKFQNKLADQILIKQMEVLDKMDLEILNKVIMPMDDELKQLNSTFFTEFATQRKTIVPLTSGGAGSSDGMVEFKLVQSEMTAPIWSKYNMQVFNRRNERSFINPMRYKWSNKQIQSDLEEFKIKMWAVYSNPAYLQANQDTFYQSLTKYLSKYFEYSVKYIDKAAQTEDQMEKVKILEQVTGLNFTQAREKIEKLRQQVYQE
ncbi:hypothetical protein FGO68_gene6067 [Halteria grandinella]|uniref:Dynamin N-terminal domain-containing protein n=1 Tax=Halteria grandinella TaxID=5974 RepID=A0A8J8NUU1_HALGN|nr:hypothetical protein FGO68_gene6067 [Halteria grandinella]